jgi:two-component system sensor histidine kinase UhpB
MSGSVPVSDAQAGGPRPGERVGRWLLRVPLPYKILGANGALIAGTAALTVLLGHLHARPALAAALAAVVGLAICLPINWALLRWALSPLSGLERAAARVHSGDLEARAPRSKLADAHMHRLIEVFNLMLARLSRGQKMLRRLSVGVLEAAERERRSLAGELQEDAAQRLAALLLRVELARQSLESTGPHNDCATYLAEVRDDAADSLEMIRRLARRLHPPELGELGLVPALRAHARAIADQAGLPVDFRVAGPSPDLEPEVALALYRIAEEALVNAVRHANAGTIRLQLETGERDVTLTIADDGRGFIPGSQNGNGSRGLGLLGMRERARAVGGSVELVSAVGSGAVVGVTVPRRAPAGPSSPG